MLKSINPIVQNAIMATNATVGTNGVGDCFSDAAYYCSEALKSLRQGNDVAVKANLNKAKGMTKHVTSYSWADAKDKSGVSRCVALIDKAISNPTESSIRSAETECTKERKRADGAK